MAYGYGNPGTWGTAGYGSTAGFYSPTNPGWGNAATVAKKPRKTAATSPASILDSFDPAAMAQEDTDKIINALLDSVRQQQEVERQAAQREAQDALARGQALAYGLQQLGLSNNIQQIFQNAAQNQGSLAQGFSGNIRDEAQAQADAQAKALAGTGQEGAVRNEGAGMGNVNYGLGGYIPGTSLNTIGAAFSADAALQPGFATQFGALDQALRLKQYADQAPERNAEINAVLARKPELFQQFLTQNRQIQSQKQAAKAEAEQQAYARWKDQRDFAYQQITDRITTDLAFSKMSDEQKYRQAQLELKQWEAMNPPAPNLQSKTLANGQVQWFDPKTGAKVGPPVGPTKKPATAPKAKGGVSANTYSTRKKQAGEAADLFYWGDEAKGVEGIDYQTALKRLQSEYGLKLKDAQAILDTRYKPGEDGRPYLSYQQRQKLRSKGISDRRINAAMWDEAAAAQLLRLLG